MCLVKATNSFEFNANGVFGMHRCRSVSRCLGKQTDDAFCGTNPHVDPFGLPYSDLPSLIAPDCTNAQQPP